MNDGNKIKLKILANTIKEKRLLKGLTQEQLAYLSDLDRTYIGMLERCERNPSYLTLVKICKGLDIKLVELFNENQ
ncbi:helix-turn-helix transcriptional regulator [Campylobacter sp. RKI_CA19_01116]|uniref:helix-turn-helix transcriptional regulator n=1 Tax=Campylobacter sp. RKI_CA19_01116 TaxID=2911625 RepID=UPI0021E7ECDB|nr:helix-turn-helix transcriptional regulator [Campylobacter sp. RKI_CA19_01116]MCV3397627.1 helix-turn-helix transcriptional regulator [Campylobacter sp. RKI_CA19_01116]